MITCLLIRVTVTTLLLGFTSEIPTLKSFSRTNGIEYLPNDTSHVSSSIDPNVGVKLARAEEGLVNKPNNFQTISSETVHQNIENVTYLRWVDGIFWNKDVEKALPSGYSQRDDISWRKYLNTTSVVKIEEGCGRRLNRLLTFADGTQACCRYRKIQKLIQGEIYSFYLGRILGLHNLAPTSLAVIKAEDSFWVKVKSQVAQAYWRNDKAVILTKFLDSLVPEYIPDPFRQANKRLDPVDTQGSLPEVVRLAQWSDLIIFDYLTANVDRLVSTMVAVGGQMDSFNVSTNNLERVPDSGLLVFLDNEYGLITGYGLMLEYELFQRELLDRVCVFRQPTVDALVKLRTDHNVGHLLNKLKLDELGPEVLPNLPKKHVRILNGRIQRVLKHVAWCRKKYSSPQGQ